MNVSSPRLALAGALLFLLAAPGNVLRAQAAARPATSARRPPITVRSRRPATPAATPGVAAPADSAGNATPGSPASAAPPRPPASPGGAKPAPAAKGSAESTPPAGQGSEESAASGGGFVVGLRAFIKAHYVWILVLLGLGLALLVPLSLRGPRGRRKGRPYLESLDAELGSRSRRRRRRRSSSYSSTKIRAADVNRRLGGTVSGTEVETDREYALVVEEEALRRPAPGEVDEKTGKEYVEDGEIRGAVQGQDFASAYDAYVRQIERDGEAEFHDDLEHVLSEHFIQRREFAKAARVLEHHVATHSSDSIDPRVYFNLGYVHFLTRTFNKSRRFLRLYIDREPDRGHATRARGILRDLEVKIGGLN